MHEVQDQRVHQLAMIWRIGNDRHPAVAVAGQRVMPGRDVAAIDAAQVKGLQMPD